MSCGPSDYIAVTPGALGDTYQIAALCRAFRDKTGEGLHLVVKHAHREMVEMFPGHEAIQLADDSYFTKFGQQRVSELRRGMPTMLSPPNFYVQPDLCVAHGRLSDLGMYALMLGLHPATPAAAPVITADARKEANDIAAQLGIVIGGTALLVDAGHSWPPIDTAFWGRLTGSIKTWKVLRNDPARIPLRCIIPFAELCGWVIGTNTGLMTFLVGAEAACRKTVITQSIEQDYSGGSGMPLPCQGTFPWRYERNIGGQQYDIEEFRVEGRDDYQRVIEWVTAGRNALGPEPDYRPIPYIEAPISAGELADRLSILIVKMEKIPHRAHMMRQEYAYLWEIYERLTRTHPKLHKHFGNLVNFNRSGWDDNQILIDAYANGATPEQAGNGANVLAAFGRTLRANQARVRIKNEISDIFRSPREEKSYAS